MNFLSPEAAGRASRRLHGWGGRVRTLWSEVQGRDAYVEKYRNSPVMHHKVPEEYRPVLLAGGEPVPFPGPTRAIRAPRFRDR